MRDGGDKPSCGPISSSAATQLSNSCSNPRRRSPLSSCRRLSAIMPRTVVGAKSAGDGRLTRNLSSWSRGTLREEGMKTYSSIHTCSDPGDRGWAATCAKRIRAEARRAASSLTSSVFAATEVMAALLSEPPNVMRLSCGAKLESSQMEFYNRRRAPPASCACYAARLDLNKPDAANGAAHHLVNRDT